MASAVELVWQWAFLISVLLIVMILCCCFGGCWGSFVANVRGCCADGINCGFAPFRKKKKKVLVTKKTRAPNGDVLLKVEEAEDLEADVARRPAHEGPWHGICGGFVSLVTCCYCCGALKPEGEGEEYEAMLPENVAQPVMPLLPGKEKPRPAPAPAPEQVPPALYWQPKPVVKAEPVVEPLAPPAVANSRTVVVNEEGVSTGAPLPILHFYATS